MAKLCKRPHTLAHTSITASCCDLLHLSNYMYVIVINTIEPGYCGLAMNVSTYTVFVWLEGMYETAKKLEYNLVRAYWWYTCFTVIVLSSQHSWKWFLYYRCQNVNRGSKPHHGNPQKRQKLDDQAVHLCPPVHGEDDVSYGRNLELLYSEMAKAKPRSDALKDLMRRTFPNRWDAFVNNHEPATLLEYLTKFPLLKKPSYVNYHYIFAIFVHEHCTCLFI